MTSLIGESALSGLCELAATTPAGAFVEFGVYQGGSAQRLAAVASAQGRELHLFDTFTGIPFCDPGDSHLVGDFSDTSESAVRALVPSAVFHVGVFPETMPENFPRIAFAHIDADQYRSIVDAVRVFRPLMVSEGIMWFDDPGCLESANRALAACFPVDAIFQHPCGKYFVRF
jgi:O-methyltransferase